MSDEKNVRHRFTVPVADKIVNEWIEKQSNLGFSLRVLIKAFVSSYGYQDATCLEFGTPVKKRGRPPKQVKIQYDDIGSENFESNSDLESDIPDDYIDSNNISDDQNHIVENLNKKPDKKLNNSMNIKSEEVEVEVDDDGFVDPESLF